MSKKNKFRTGRTPYLRQIMDTLASKEPGTIVTFKHGCTPGPTTLNIDSETLKQYEIRNKSKRKGA